MTSNPSRSATPTPDFDHYPCRHKLVAAQVQGPTTVALTWSDGRVDRHHPWTLRENTVDPSITAAVTRERLTDIATWGDDVAVESIGIDHGGELEITWAPDQLRARYHVGWLRHLGGAAWTPDAVRPAVEHWDASLAQPPTFNGPQYLGDDEVLNDALTTLATTGLIRLQALPLEHDTVNEVGRRIGVVRPTHFGPDFDVIARLDADSQAYTGARLAPHTDIPTRENEPGLQLLHCLVNTVPGGESLMVDGFAVAEWLRQHEPDTFTALTDLHWVWANRSTTTDVRWSAPVIGLAPVATTSGLLHHAPIDEIRMANTLRLFPDMAHDDVDRAYRALRRFAELCDSPEFKITFPFAPGDCVIFDNRRVLHGREPFDEHAGERHLRGCYVDRDDLLSRLRMLARARRFRVSQEPSHYAASGG